MFSKEVDTDPLPLGPTYPFLVASLIVGLVPREENSRWRGPRTHQADTKYLTSSSKVLRVLCPNLTDASLSFQWWSWAGVFTPEALTITTPCLTPLLNAGKGYTRLSPSWNFGLMLCFHVLIRSQEGVSFRRMSLNRESAVSFPLIIIFLELILYL